MSRRIYRHDMTTYLTLGFLFDGVHKRIASVCHGKWKGKLIVPNLRKRRIDFENLCRRCTCFVLPTC
jgi:hypothetical protein